MSSTFLSGNGMAQLILVFGLLFVLVKPLGAYIARVYTGERTMLTGVLGPLEKIFYRLCGIKPEQEMSWQAYATAVLAFSFIGGLSLYAILRFQDALPLNPMRFPGLSPDLAFNTAISFLTNTNWQSYAGESTMSYFSQVAGLAVQNFLSAAVGMAVLVVLIRGFTRKNTPMIGNFWVDLVRGVLYILLPLSLIFALVLSSQGVVQSFKPYAQYAPLQTSDSSADTPSFIPLGPAASQIAIKQLGTNGGGFFNTNSAHPFENPTPLSNFLQLIAILLLPMALCYSFGKMVGDTRQGWAILFAMTIIFLPLMLVCLGVEQAGNPKLTALGVDQQMSMQQPGGNMEGKEVRFGVLNSAVWAAATTAASNGSVNAMHESFLPLSGMVPMVLMQFGEVIYGGAGSGLYGMMIFVIVAVFIAGLMVGRTPEYLGKKISVYEMKMASLVILIPSLVVLLGLAVAVLEPAGKAGVAAPGAHGFSEALYAFTSAGNNNGSAFAGFSANTPFYNTILGLLMFVGRFWIMIPVLAIAGSLAAKNTVPVSPGTLATHTPLFIGILAGVVVMVGVLTYVPALALGPVAEHLHLMVGQ